ncbi:hypothetical protein PF005_g8307 [Phytophthora fragariae]|uniref:Uncharacterized protein n=1 Tax=Phytophthora fragariae TaxID=53985 RepID=A0A6A3SD98_9STRA|nr:hypothetical protein PF003_g37344 [Phytophthora fragariae]KAE8941028.1 hypothetical protein PF009_g9170 [Phytophthora fragariae]KAE9016149.1 hypothetical protein PF011_g7285 [Phytophthora fragariae]KAE9114768.1 hypothetical protein PF007_g10251 [Phytophthora fragariae]KAE9145765.1 hypothetical protein PF006_g9414 [Phytophthora fragariae]
MVNKFKRFFKSLGGKNSHSSSGSSKASASSLPSENGSQFVSGPYGSSSSVAFHASTSRNLSTAELEARLETSGSLTGAGTPNQTMITIEDYVKGGVVDWAALLSRIPKLVAECTTCSSPPATTKRNASKAPGDFADLLVLLQQMAGRENQERVRQFYAGREAFPSASPSWNQRHKLFRQCRRGLLLCWKFLVARLNDERATLPTETRNMYFQLIGMIMERVEFHLPVGGFDADTTANTRTKTPKSSGNTGGAGVGWLANSPTASLNGMDFNDSHDDFENSENAGAYTNKNHGTGDDSADGERDLYLYRCLLIATFKYAVENLEAARLKQRSYISLVETRFYARVFAVCYFRVPVLQSVMLEQIFGAYREKEWISLNAHDSRVEDLAEENSGAETSPKYSGRRPSASRPWNGNTFAGSLVRWTEYGGYNLGEEGNGNGTSSAKVTSRYNSKHFAAATSALRSDEEEFVRQNPTLFKWTRFSPYLGPYPDSDIFRMTDATRNCWLQRLSHDGEFFSKFMGFVCLHATNTALGSDVVWTCLPGYTLLIRVSLLLLKEACWAKWLYVRDTSGPLPSSSMEIEPGSQEEERLPFDLESIRAIRTVLDNVVQLLRNNQLLESCVLAMYECINVLHARSVEVCLTRFEEWFSATAMLTEIGGADKRRGSGMMVYRLPPGFRGQTFATGMRFMLSSENCEILASTLLFLYHRMDYFEGDLRQSILKALVQRHMLFFLHWNADVRTKYHHLLVYRVVRANRFVLDSPMDHLLVGRCAISSLELSRAHDDDIDEDDDSYRHHGKEKRFHDTACNPTMSAADLNVLRTEQALWRAFDACLAVIVAQERRYAREGNRKFQNEQLAARNRALAFRTLNRNTTEDSNAAATTSVNEGLPGGKPCHEVELLDTELRREPPYYLRYLPGDELAMLDDLRRLASTVKYPHYLQVYAAHSLRCYSDLLKQYYRELDSTGSVEPPPLGFF